MRASALSFLALVACPGELPGLLANAGEFQDECTQHLDCDLTAAQCLAGRCVPSEEADVLLAHIGRAELLGANHSIHAIELTGSNRGIDPEQVGDWQRMEGTDWWTQQKASDARFALHRSGLLAVAVSEAKWAGRADSNDLRRDHPFRRLDSRAYVGGKHLLDVVQQFIDFGLLSASDASRVYAGAPHSFFMVQDQGHLATDIALGHVNRETRQRLGMPGIVNLLANASPRDIRVSPFSNTMREEMVGRRFTFHSEAAMQLRLVYAGAERLELHLEIDGERHPIEHLESRTATDPQALVIDLAAGQHEVSVRGRTELLGVLRVEVYAPGQIHLDAWRSLHGRYNDAGLLDDEEGSPMDGHARPRILFLSKGPVVDGDGDGWPDVSDLCPRIPDEAQDDDQDGRGDSCDGIAHVSTRGERVVALNRRSDILFDMNGFTYDEMAWQLAKLPHSIVTDPQRSGFAGGVVIQTREALALSEGQPEADLYLLRKDGQPWGRTMAQPTHRLSGTSHHGRLTALDFWGTGETLFAASTYLIRQYGAQRAIERFDHLSLGVATLPVTPNQPFLHMAQEVASPSLMVAGRYKAPEPPLVVPGRDEREGMCVDLPVANLHRCETSADCPTRPGRGQLTCAGGKCMTPCEQSRDCPSVPGGEPMRCIANFCVVDDLLGFSEKRSTFETCRPEGGEGACEVGLCLSLNNRALAAYFQQLATLASQRSAAGWIALAPLAQREGNSRLFFGREQDGVMQFNLESTGSLIGLCPDRGAEGTALDETDYMSDLLAHFVGAKQFDPELNFVPGWVSEAANQCFAFQSNRIAFGQTLTPRHLRLVDLDGDGVEEIRLRGSLAADVSVTAGTVFRCFDYRGQVVEAGCEP